VKGYGLVLMGSAAVELDQSPAVVEHNEFSGGTQVRKTLGQLQPFIAAFPQEYTGQLASSGPT
jgi:hypothetical protein